MSEAIPGEFYFTIEKDSFAEFKDRGSRFLAYAFPVANAEEFKKRLKDLKEEHPKAVHHCFAYQIGTDGNNLPAGRQAFRSSDDGEPSGSAGRPILGQIDTHSLTNTAVVVVRYFGGSLLGVPGLINAYKTATSFALQINPFIKKHILTNYRLHFDYTMMNDVMLVIKKYNCEIIRQEIQLFCSMEIGIPIGKLADVFGKLKNLHQVEVASC